MNTSAKDSELESGVSAGGHSVHRIVGRGFACVGLWQPKTASNVGAILRAAGCYGAAMVAVQGARYSHAATDTQKTWKHTPLLQVDDLRNVLPTGCVPVAVDLVDRARPLMQYTHPERAFYVFGGEDRTLGGDVLEWCRDVIYVPTAFCMNLAAAVNVVLYDRLTKRSPNSEVSRGATRR